MIPSEMSGCREVSLDGVLEARERRVALQTALLSKSGPPVICFTLNIAGPYKAFPLGEKAFAEGKRLIERKLRHADISVQDQTENIDHTGYAALYAVCAEPVRVKKLMCDIEESCSLGRLFDIDVLGAEGIKISREDIGFDGRKCLICGKPAPECARSRAHSVSALQEKTIGIIKGYFDEQHAEHIAKKAVRALLYEVAVTPKPGLVDRFNNGAHRDMDFYTFIDSATELFPYFRLCALKGASHRQGADTLLEEIRPEGRCAEEAMYQATSGVNTHKGAIFSLGILCAAAGFLHGQGLPVYAGALADTCAAIAAPALAELRRGTGATGATNGEKLYGQYGVLGVRGEAASGFSTVMRYGLPVLAGLLSEGFSRDQAGAVALLHLMAYTQDTNMASRAGFDALEQIQKPLRALLEGKTPEQLLERLSGLDDDFICRNISPGGCADLLAVAWMMYFIDEPDIP